MNWPFKTWGIKLLATKLIKRGLLIVVSWMVAHNIQGLTIDPDVLSLTIWAGLESLRNFLKVEWNWKWL